MDPYYQDDYVTLYHADCREGLASIKQVSAVITDPPYGDTSLAWDSKDMGWISMLPSNTVWCFGSMRYWFAAEPAFREAGWKYAQEIVWEKHNGSSFHADRFQRVHEFVVQWYKGPWGDLHHNVPTTPDAVKRTVRSKHRPPHMGEIGDMPYQSEDGGPRLMRSVLGIRSCHGYAVHPTQKPIALIIPLIEYSTLAGETIVDCFSGSGSVLRAAKDLKRRAVGYEISEEYCEAAAKRLQQEVLAL